MKDRILDFIRSPQDCRGRIKRLKTKYFQVKRQNKNSEGKRTSFPYPEKIDTILGTRPSVNPVALSDSLNSQDDESDRENDPNETIGDTKDEDDTSDMSRQPESQPRSETPGPSRPGTPGSSRFYSRTRMKTTKRKKEDPAEIMQQFLEMEKTSEKQFLEFDEKRLKLETEQEEKRRKEEADREDRQRNADRQFMANLMQMQINIMRMQQAPPPRTTTLNNCLF
ncbi:unnamed protein product [Mytilus coruscus]|uniref:Uncharacterized protein n=1 Tax=Mytilus coruscus TaxID=42192 RepID=A0A6J8CMG7_MYTCO|nr:unnamed protein product [Mytilus coruscus]